MKIDHIAIWVKNLEEMKLFYEKYFGMKSGEKYTNAAKGYSSYFLSFNCGARIELMFRTDITNFPEKTQVFFGFAHLAIQVGGKENVSSLTKRLEIDGYKVVSQPRTTGDGYFESVVEDTEGNLIEICA